MHAGLEIDHLLEYTDWERQSWRDWLRRNGGSALEVNAGSNGDGRFQKTGDVIRHIFSAEKRYVDRLSGREITDTSALPAGDFEALFRFAEQSRSELRQYIGSVSSDEWDRRIELQLFNSFLSASPRKIVVHVLLHEIRHWAQIATILRLNGMKGDFHDLLFSPVFGGEFRRAV